jgi:hypothetical protein
VGEYRKEEVLNTVSHKLGHFVVGAAGGAIGSKEIETGALAGAFGAAGAEIFAECLSGFAAEQAQANIEQEILENGGITRARVDEIEREAAQDVARISKLLVASAAAVLELDVDLASQAADTALTHNWLAHINLFGKQPYNTEKLAKDVNEVVEYVQEQYEDYCEASAAIDNFVASTSEIAKAELADSDMHPIQREAIRIAIAQDCFEVFDPQLKPLEDHAGFNRDDTKLLFAAPMLALGGVQAGAPLVNVVKGVGKKVADKAVAGAKVARKGTAKVDVAATGSTAKAAAPKVVAPKPTTTRSGGKTSRLQVAPEGLAKGPDAAIFTPSKEQPWTMREGQEWKAKVVGRAQKTGTPGHATRSYREAIAEAKLEDTEKVFLNRGYKKATGEPVKPNRRPDVTVVKKDGTVNAVEVKSKTDKKTDLESRNIQAMGSIAAEKRGKIRVINPTSNNKNKGAE